MATVCQQCGDVGYEALLVYCSLCHEAARHQYCLNDIPDLDEYIEWSCEDCILGTKKVGVNDHYLVMPSKDLSLSSKENIISNENKYVNGMHVARYSKNKASLHVHKHEMKAHENANKRSIRTMKFDSSIDEGSTVQATKHLKYYGRRRKLILPIEDDDESLDGVAKGSSMQSEINASRIHGSFEKSKHDDNMKKSIMLDKENVYNNIEQNLKEVKDALKVNEAKVLGVKPIEQNTTIDADMTMKGESNDDLIKSSGGFPLSDHLQNSSRSQCKLNDVLAMPINWRGWFQICGRVYGPLVAHFSPKNSENAWKSAGSLPQVIQLTTVSRSYAYPKSFENSPPTDEHIALFFFPPDSRVEKKVDQLLQELIRCDLMLKVALDEAELLVFPSNLLPENYKRYRDKHYLWGVFKSKDSDRNIGEIVGQTYESTAKQTVPNSSIESQDPQIESDNEMMSLEGYGTYLTDEGGKQTVSNLSVESEEVLIKKSLKGNETQESLFTPSDADEDLEMGNDLRTGEDVEMIFLEEYETYLTDEGGKQTAPNLSVESEKILIKRSLEGNETQESLFSPSDVGEEVEMGNDRRTGEKLFGCLELFPTQVENMALRLKMGDMKESVDLELSLGLPFRPLRTFPLD